MVGVAGLLLLGSGCASVRPPAGGREPLTRTMLTTGYCPCKECCSWHRNWLGRPVYSSGPLKGQRKEVGVTASGTKARPGVIAADGDRYPFGTVMHVPGYGYGRVEDRGGAIEGDHVDLFFRTHEEARQWGRRFCRVKVWIL